MSTDYQSTLNPQELEKFNRLAHDWWDLQGPFKPLHQMNPVRLNRIHDSIDLHNKRVLDVGCGGGILAESMARRGAQVTAIDLADKVLEIARNHATQEQLNIDYQQKSAEQLAGEQPESWDLVTCLEMLEHVPDPQAIVAACSTLVKPGGTVVFSTLNRNPKSFLLAIVGAEYLLNLLPKGTHSYASFIRPSELIGWAENSQLIIQDTTGVLYNPFTEKFAIGSDVSVNYMLITTKGE